MLALLVITLFGILFSVIATQNTLGVPIRIMSYEFYSIPLYLVALFSLLIGVILSWSLSLFDWLSTAFTLRGKDVDLKHSNQEIIKLKQQLNDLKIENSRLKGEKEEIKVEAGEKVEEIKKNYPRPNLIDRIRHIASI